MSRGALFETLVGAAVVAVAAAFLWYAFGVTGGRRHAGAYHLSAVFGRIDGVDVGADVRIAGVKVGAVAASRLDPKTYEATLDLSLDKGVAVPEDSVAKIASDGLLGGAHVSIEPGASDEILKDGAAIHLTQGSIDLLGLAVQAFTEGNKGARGTPNGDAGEKASAGDAGEVHH